MNYELITEINFNQIIKDISKEININSILIKNVYADADFKIGSLYIDNKGYLFKLTKNNKYRKNSLKLNK